MVFTKKTPKLTALIVYRIYNVIVLMPIRDNFNIFNKLEISFIKDTNIRGTAINFSRLRNITLQGFTQSTINLSIVKFTVIKPAIIPKPMPIKILTYSGIVFLSYFFHYNLLF